MARRFTSSRGRSSAPQRQIGNDGFSGFATLNFGASTVATGIGSIGLALVVPAATLVRTRGLYSLAVVASGTINQLIRCVMGVHVVSLEAFNAGLASLPTPLQDIERPWVVWQANSIYADVTGGASANAYGSARLASLDSRGMRKMKVNEVLAVTFEAEQLSATTGTTVVVSYDLRLQFKL